MKSVADKALELAAQSTESEPSKVEQGIKRISDVRKSMKDSFVKGKKRGLTTCFNSIDPHFTWKKGDMICATGYPNHGKTELIIQLMLTRSAHYGDKWALFSPENYPVDELYDTLIHAYIGKTTDVRFPYRMTEKEYEDGMDFIGEHFFAIDPIEDPTVENILKYFEYLIKTDKVDGCLIDPWNQMIHLFDSREDQYLSNEFTRIKRFTQKYNQYMVITAHPKSPAKATDGSLPVPDQFSLSGGAMWNNKFDVILSVHRPNYFNDKTDTLVEFHSHKIKKQKLVGIPGKVDLSFDRKSNRYFEMNGQSPLQPIEVSKIEPEDPWK